MDITDLETQTIDNHALEPVVETDPEELSPAEVEERYLELLRIKAKEIGKAVQRDHQIDDLARAPREKRQAARLDLTRRIIDLLESEQKILIDTGIESKNSPQFERFVKETGDWLHKLSRQDHLEMFTALNDVVKKAEITMPVPETAETTTEKKDRLIAKTKDDFSDSLGFLSKIVGDEGAVEAEKAEAKEIPKKVELAPVLVEVKPDDSLWSILENGLSK